MGQSVCTKRKARRAVIVAASFAATEWPLLPFLLPVHDVAPDYPQTDLKAGLFKPSPRSPIGSLSGSVTTETTTTHLTPELPAEPLSHLGSSPHR